MFWHSFVSLEKGLDVMRPYKTLGLFLLFFSLWFIHFYRRKIDWIVRHDLCLSLVPLVFDTHHHHRCRPRNRKNIYRRREGDTPLTHTAQNHTWRTTIWGIRVTQGRQTAVLPSGIETHEEEWDERRRFSYISQSFFHPLSLLFFERRLPPFLRHAFSFFLLHSVSLFLHPSSIASPLFHRCNRKSLKNNMQSERRGKHEGNRQKMTCSFTRFPWFITCHFQSHVSFLWSTCLSMPLITPQNDTQIE